MRVFFCLKDLIVMARSKEWAMFHTSHLILHRAKLGFAINWKESSPLPRQRVEFLGVVLTCGPLCQNTDGPGAGGVQVAVGIHLTPKTHLLLRD